MKRLHRFGTPRTPVVWQYNACLGSDASLHIEQYTWFILYALNMLLLDLPDVLHSLLVQKRDTKKVSAFDPDQLTEELLYHDDSLPLYSCLPSAVQGQFPLGDVLSTRLSVMPGTPSCLSCSHLA